MEIAAIVFVLVVLAVAYVSFRLLKRTVKMAVRALVVLVLVFVAAVGGTALWFVGGDEKPSKAPSKSSSKRAR